MAVPKRRTSRANTHSRRAQWTATPPPSSRSPSRAPPTEFHAA
ncbi:50S ribosomal protein L32 (plasmid) [Rhodococcus rhodochrous]|nr:50S ribosomal protein L32 [Rhodococcus rhodochrous]